MNEWMNDRMNDRLNEWINVWMNKNQTKISCNSQDDYENGSSDYHLVMYAIPLKNNKQRDIREIH